MRYLLLFVFLLSSFCFAQGQNVGALKGKDDSAASESMCVLQRDENTDWLKEFIDYSKDKKKKKKTEGTAEHGKD